MKQFAVFHKTGLVLVLALPLSFLAPQAHSQDLDDLYIYGFFQGRFIASDESSEGLDNGPEKRNGFTLQQLNVMMAKDFGSHFSAFLNVEVTNSFSTFEKWGHLKLEEAWVRYSHSRFLNVKVGLQIPTFNNLNEIKNRTPLLPYIFRPSVYESAYSEVLNNKVFLPRQGFFSVEGSVPLDHLKLDYSVFIGNQDAFITSINRGSSVAGSDTTTQKLVGGRVGLRYNGVKIGVSVTNDDDNLVLGNSDDPDNALPVGAVPRWRYGADLSFDLWGFFFESELIMLRHNPSIPQQGILDFVAALSPFVGTDPDKLFYYVLLGYNISDQFYVYGYRDYVEDRILLDLAEGYTLFFVGGGYRPIDSVVFKIQYGSAKTNGPNVSYSGRHLIGAVSVLF